MIAWLRGRTIRVRLTLWYLATLALVLLLLDAAIYFSMRRALDEHLDESVEQRWDSLAALLVHEDGRPLLPASLDVRDDDEDEQDSEPFARTWTAPGDLASNGGARGDLPGTGAIVARALAVDESWGTIGQGEDSYRVLVRRVDGGLLEVGESREQVVESLASLRQVMLVVTPLGLLLATAGGLLLAQRALAPIALVTKLARQTTGENLGGRLDLQLPDDEVGRLAATFDEMLARLEASFQQQRQFTADASHELRTPLAALKGQVEVALGRERTAADYRAVLAAVNGEIDRLIRLVGSLLTLARADAGQIPLHPEPVEIGELIAAAAEQVRPLARQHGLDVVAEGPPGIVVAADEVLLLQLLLNLLDNAIRHSPPGAEIRVRWSTEADDLRIAVHDTGIGIAPEHLPHLFDRFYRVDAARSGAGRGTGLGLAISDWISRAHGGRILVESTPGVGSTFTVVLPRRRPEDLISI